MDRAKLKEWVKESIMVYHDSHGPKGLTPYLRFAPLGTDRCPHGLSISLSFPDTVGGRAEAIEQVAEYLTESFVYYAKQPKMRGAKRPPKKCLQK